VAIELIPYGNVNVGKVLGFLGVNNAYLTLFISLSPLALNFKKNWLTFGIY
jgi:hypothetical protein